MHRSFPWLLIPLLLLPAHGAWAQFLASYLPQGVPGYDTSPGVTVQSRVRPEQDPLGIRIDNGLIKPTFSESVGYDDNVFGGQARRGAWEVVSEPSVLIGTESSQGSIGLSASATDTRYLEQPSQNRTDGGVFLGGTIPFGQDKLTLGAGYLARHEDRTALDALPSDRPVAFQVADVRASYEASLGFFTLTPSFDLTRWRFADTTILDVPVTQTTRDRTTALAEVTLRYAWMPARTLLLVTRVLDTHYDFPAAGVPSNNSVRWQILAGADYDENAVWRFRALGGVEISQAAVSQTDGVMEAEAIWSPSGLTDVTFNATRGIEDAAQTGLSSFTYTSGAVTLNHELARDILLTATARVMEADYAVTGARQTGVAAGAGVTWLIRRGLRLSFTYGVDSVRDRHVPANVLAGDHTRQLTLLTLRFGL
jgi:hypothetical protein